MISFKMSIRPPILRQAGLFPRWHLGGWCFGCGSNGPRHAKLNKDQKRQGFQVSDMNNSPQDSPAAPTPKKGVFKRRRQRRLVMVLIALPSLLIAAAITAKALKSTAVYFYPPAELPSPEILNGREVRLGGMVVEGSLRQGENAKVMFAITDFEKTVEVEYHDLLPPLFRDGQGVIVQGTLSPDGHFIASEVMAKHDENYMPPEVADSLKQPSPDPTE